MASDARNDFVIAVLIRPWIYTYTGSYYETVTFLTAYISGLQAAFPVPSVPDRNSAPWFDFRDWLRTRPGNRLLAPGEDPLKRLFENSTDDAEAIHEVLRLYREFTSEIQQT